MKFDEADSELLKTWTIRRLEHVSDADSDVLADYVLALVSTDEGEASAKANCTENLKDFLGDQAEPFVEHLFDAIATKSYDPSKPPPKPARPPYQPPRRASIDPGLNPPKKRSYHDWDRDETQNQHNDASRPLKAARRGVAGRGRGGRHYFPPPPTPPPGMPAWDPDNPFASVVAMSAAMGLLPPGFELPQYMQPARPAELCRDYHNKGFCTRGAQCPYDHGLNPHVVPPEDEYDPTNSGLFNVHPARTGLVKTSPRGQKASKRGRRHSRGASHEPQSSEFSHRGPNYDRSITQIVVEQIPEDKFDEQSVSDFFGQFGEIEGIELRNYKRAAIVRFADYDAANAAYHSPKVVFDNRFVKVYWYYPRGQSGIAEEEQELEIDLEQVAQKQEEAQRRHELKQKALEDARQHKEAFDAQLRKLQEEKSKVLRDLARKQGKPVEQTADDAGDNERTRGLREQLAKLEEEAKALGIDPNAASETIFHYPRGRGGYRGRGRGRGGYNPSYRGGWNGAGARGGAVKRLDNRPKTICLIFAEGSYQNHQETLRSWLLFNSQESASLTKHPHQDAALIAFPERYLGEVFMDAALRPDFPLVGKVQQLFWYQPDDNSDTAMEEAPTSVSQLESTDDVDDVDHSGRWD